MGQSVSSMLNPQCGNLTSFFSVANKQWCFFAYIFVNEQKKKTAVISLPIRFYEYQIWSHEYSEGVNTLAEFETDLTCSWKNPPINGILIPKLFWSTVRKKISSDREKNSKIFEIIRTICSNSERSEQFLVTECFFNLFLEVSQI